MMSRISVSIRLLVQGGETVIEREGSVTDSGN